MAARSHILSLTTWRNVVLSSAQTLGGIMQINQQISSIKQFYLKELFDSEEAKQTLLKIREHNYRIRSTNNLWINH
jgi:hypothetical protein